MKGKHRSEGDRVGRKVIDETGNRYGSLVVIEQFFDLKGKGAHWICECDCGNKTAVRGSDLRSGHTKGCGCMKGKNRRLAKGEAAFNALFGNRKRDAKRRGLEWRLTKEQVHRLSKQNCHYCGAEPSQSFVMSHINGEYVYNGLDRVDNTKGYVIDNVVPCCFNCNYSKGTRTASEYKAWIDRSYKFQHSLL